MLALRTAIAEMIDISSEEVDRFLSMCYPKFFKKKAIISEEERYINEVYFVVDGLLRVKIVDLEGRQHTTHFAFENRFIADYTAFINREKSSYSLEAVEDSRVMVLPRSAIEWGYTNLREGEKLGRLIAEYYFTYMDTRIMQRYTLSPIERYDLMDETFPGIHNRVPQHMIASYLGITPIHLSRIKKERSE